MTTPIHTETKRKTEGKHRGRKVIVTIAPGDIIGFRFERTRETYWTTIAACADMAIRQKVAADRAAKKKSK